MRFLSNKGIVPPPPLLMQSPSQGRKSRLKKEESEDLKVEPKKLIDNIKKLKEKSKKGTKNIPEEIKVNINKMKHHIGTIKKIINYPTKNIVVIVSALKEHTATLGGTLTQGHCYSPKDASQ